MVTGQRAFRGDSKLSTLMEVTQKEPAPLDPRIPQELDRIICRCLRKDPARRFQTMADLKVALEEVNEESDSGTLRNAQPASGARRAFRLPIAAGALGVVVLAAVVWLWFGRSTGPQAPLTTVPLTTYMGTEVYPSFSPDGKSVIFARADQQNSDLMLMENFR